MCNKLITRDTVALLILLWLPGQIQAGGLQPYDGYLQSPALTLQDLGGNTHHLSDYRGQVVLVNFWASWCPPCIIEMPSMQRLKQAMAGKPFSILAVNVKESPGTIWKFLRKVKINFMLLRDSDGQAARAWQINVYPSSYLVDPAGEIHYVAYGPRQWDEPEILQLIEEMLIKDDQP